MDHLFITAVDTEKIDALWPGVKGFLQSALDYSHGAMNIDDVKNFLMIGNLNLWVVLDKKSKKIRMAIVTEVLQHRRKKICRCILAGGGNAKMWVITSGHIETWAKSTGCDRLESSCRAGFEKVFKESGYKKLYTVLAKEL